MSILLAPAFLWGCYCFGLQALFPVLAAIASALIGEAFVGLLLRHFTLGDGTAFLTGLLVGLAMPPAVPLYIPVASALFAVCVVKGAFGGLGSNWMNPALAGLVFALLNWPEAMSAWIAPHHLASVEALSGASPLGLVHASALGGGGVAGSTMGILGASGYAASPADGAITSFFNSGLFRLLGVELPSGYMDLLIGNKAGSIGELSGFLLLAASVVLVSRRMVRWEIPASIFASFAILVWAFSGLPYGRGFFSGDILFEIFSGSFIIVAFFMATDPVTSPSTFAGRLLYGCGIGCLIFIIRRFGSSAEGSAFAVIIMNCFTPLLSKLGRARVPGLREAA
jgi:electron transport complex protein RnfD